MKKLVLIAALTLFSQPLLAASESVPAAPAETAIRLASAESPGKPGEVAAVQADEQNVYVVLYDYYGKPMAHGMCPADAITWIPE